MWKKKLWTNGSEDLNADEDYTFLAKGVEMQGIAKLEGVVRIDGCFQGTIHTNNLLILGEYAMIRGSITADEIICSGTIEAKLTVQKGIQLLNPAVLIGDITTHVLTMEEGVFFKACARWG